MPFNIALFASLLLAPEVLAIPSRLVPRVAWGRQARPFHGLEGGASDGTVYSSNWAGAMWAENSGTFQTVTGTFTIPTLSNTNSSSNFSSAAAWVGIDGYTCQSAIFQTGISFTLSSGQVSYSAWYEWVPAYAADFSGIAISAGDVVKLTIATTSTTSGTATIENLTNNQTVSKSLTSTGSLCQQNVEWIVEDYFSNGQLVPFADFGTVTFANAEATGNVSYAPSGATITEIEQNNRVLTSVSTNGSSVTIKYV